MPFQSSQQRRLFYAKRKRGEISDETITRWNAETKEQQAEGDLPKKLPRYKRPVKTAAEIDTAALVASALHGAIGGAILGSRRSLDDKTMRGVTQGAAMGAIGGLLGGQVLGGGKGGALAGGALAGFLGSRGPRGDKKKPAKKKDTAQPGQLSPQMPTMARGSGLPMPFPDHSKHAGEACSTCGSLAHKAGEHWRSLKARVKGMITKQAADDDAKARGQAQERFKKLKGVLKSGKGVMIGKHPRVAIPKHVLSENDLKKHLGFVPVKIAIPEQGQKRFTSFRHEKHNYHIHDHGTHWTMHKDEHAAATMVLRRALAKAKTQGTAAGKAGGAKASDLATKVKAKAQIAGHTAKALVGGVPHVVTEGAPGLYYYAKGKVTGAGSTLNTVVSKMDKGQLKRMSRWRPTRTPDVEKKAVTDSSQTAKQELVARVGDKANGVSLKKDSRGWYVGTHRARSASYPTVSAIPKSKVTFIESTG